MLLYYFKPAYLDFYGYDVPKGALLKKKKARDRNQEVEFIDPTKLIIDTEGSLRIATKKAQMLEDEELLLMELLH